MSSVYKIFVDKIPSNISSQDLKSRIENQASIRVEDCKVVKKDSRAFAFVTVSSQEDNSKLLAAKITIDNTQLVIKKSFPKNKPAFVSLNDNVTDVDLFEAVKGDNVVRITVFLGKAGYRSAIVYFKDSASSDNFFLKCKDGQLKVKGETLKTRRYQPPRNSSWSRRS